MLNSPQEVLQQAQVENRLGHRVLRSGLDLILEAANLFVHIREPWIRSHANHKACPGSDGISAQIEAAVQVVHNVDQANCVHVKDRSRVGIVAHLRRIAGDADQIANPDRGRSQQVTLNAQHITIAASVVQNRIDAHFALNEQRKRLVAHARRRPRTVRDVDRVHAHRFQKPRPFNLLQNVDPLWRDNLDHGDKLAASQLGPEKRTVLQRHGRHCLWRGGTSRRLFGSRFSPGLAHTQRRLHHSDMLRSGSTASAHQPNSCRHKFAGIAGHIFR